STRHVLLQPSPGVLLPSSHVSGASMTLSPQVMRLQPSSTNACEVRRRLWFGPVYLGSMTSFGVSAVLKCETEEPHSSGDGAYISTCPLPVSRPPVRNPPAATTAAPTQWRSPVS